MSPIAQIIANAASAGLVVWSGILLLVHVIIGACLLIDLWKEVD